MSVPFTLLHLSDLHFGPHCRFQGQDMKRLAEAVARAVGGACETHDLGERVDLVVVTGDVAEAARPPEYREAAAFFGALGGALGLEPARFVFVPGNHDVSWTRCRRVYDDHADGIIDEAERDRRLHVEKFEFFGKFLHEVYGQERENIDGVTRLGHGAWLHDVPSLGLSLAVLDSCERETDKVHGGHLGKTQAQTLMDHWRQPARERRLVRIVALHHNPVATVPENIDYSLRKLVERAQADALDADMVEHFRADSFGIDDSGYLHAVTTDCQVQLVLHGHHHASVRRDAWNWTKGGPGQTQILSAGSWGLEQTHLPADEGVVVHLVRVEPERPALRSLLLRYEPGLRQSGQVAPGTFAPAPDGVVELTLSLPRGLPGRKAAPAPAPAVDSGLVGAYRRAFAGTQNHWDLAVGAHHIGARPPGDMPCLDDMYQPLHLAADVERGRARRLNAHDTEPEEPGAVIDPVALLARERPMIVRGPAGAGKTTWLRWTFRRLLDASAHPDALPLFIELRALVRAWEDVPEKARSLDGYLADRLAAVMGEGYRARLAEAVPAWLAAAEGPRPVLFIDGWDEAGLLGRDLREKLLALLTLHPRVLAVVTSRPYGQDPPTTTDGFEAFDVQRLSDPDIAALTERFWAPRRARRPEAANGWSSVAACAVTYQRGWRQAGGRGRTGGTPPRQPSPSPFPWQRGRGRWQRGRGRATRPWPIAARPWPCNAAVDRGSAAVARGSLAGSARDRLAAMQARSWRCRDGRCSGASTSLQRATTRPRARSCPPSPCSAPAAAAHRHRDVAVGANRGARSGSGPTRPSLDHSLPASLDTIACMQSIGEKGARRRMHIMRNEIGIPRQPGRALLPMALGAMLALWALGTGRDARADIAVWVQHCNTRAKDGADDKHPIEVCSYNAKDTSLSVSYEQKSVPYKHVRKLKCKGEGKGFCKIRWDWEDGLGNDCNSSDEKQKVAKGKYLILYDGGDKDKWTVKIADERDPACGE